ncbi:MAG TPA: FecR domain-containing protein [Chroococcales cyanobacterium]
MFRNIALTLTVTLWGLGSLLVPSEALAQTPLSRAVLQSLKNRVQLIPKSQQARPARVSDAMTPGDALATAKASAAQLRFNDGSLARLGEQAAFKFVPGSRTFQLSNGTALVLIPPGRGTTNVRTPNAAAGIRGSALFVRYNPETETTLVGALTDSGIQVFNRDASQRQELKAGYMAVIAKDRIARVYEFDLNAFYRTSELVRGLDLTQTAPADNSDEAIASVRAETVQALKAQQPVTGENVIENPSFVQLSVNTSEDFPRTDTSVVEENSAFQEPNFSDFGNTTNVRSLLEGGEILDTRTRTGTNDNGAGGNGNQGGGNQGGGNQGTGNNPNGPGGNGAGGNGNQGGGNQGTGNNPDGPGGNGAGGNGNQGRGNQGTGNNPDGPGGNGAGGNGNSGRND